MARSRALLSEDMRQKLKDDFIFLICLICLEIGSAFYYGIRVILLFLTSIVVSFIGNWICEKLSGRIIRIANLEPAVIGALFVCLLPPSASYWMVIFGALFAQFIVLLPFGGEKNCHISSVAAAFCFCAISWSAEIFRFPVPFTTLPAFKSIDPALLTTSPAKALMMGGKPIYSIWEMLLGAVPGAMGTTCIFLILAAFIVFIQRKKNGTYMTATTLITFFILSLIFNRTTINPLTASIFELLSGSVAFGAVFMVPRFGRFLENKTAGILFSLATGIFSVFFRFFGGFEESFCFALLLTSIMIPFFNQISPDALKLSLKLVKYVKQFLDKIIKRKEKKAI
ncbi:MAG: RnfABCDGE type electron transport complex subunit D [Oscillospiraceae bacterium]|nr:RnfABCDGE type electron transport complex subunit D [Oscillospiraceae bacterium]